MPEMPSVMLGLAAALTPSTLVAARLKAAFKIR